MDKTLTHTLTRWHKIAERVKTASTELQVGMIQALNAGHNVDADTLRVRKDSLGATVDKAMGEQLVAWLALQAALFTIRQALAKANVESGVSSLLAELEQAKQELALYEAMLETQANTLSLSEFDALTPRLPSPSGTGQHLLSRVSVTFISAEDQTEMSQRRAAARQRLNQLADQLAEANASKMTLSLDEAVLSHLGL